MRFSSRADCSRLGVTSMILALPCVLVVMTPACDPVNERACAPSESMAMATSALEIRSPAVSSMSISRAGGAGHTCLARSSRSSVVSPIAETTTTTSWPAFLVSTMRSATRRIRSASATEDPPYFCTTSATVRLSELIWQGLEGPIKDKGSVHQVFPSRPAARPRVPDVAWITVTDRRAGAERPGNQAGRAGAERPGNQAGRAGAERPGNQAGRAGAERPGNQAGRHADTSVPIHPHLAARWSPRVFDSDAVVTREQVAALLEAARWGATWGDRQPVRFVVGLRGDETFEALAATLK